MAEVRDMALAFEAVKVGMRQNKDGVFLTLSIHPQQIPQDVIADLVGSRYQVALVKLNDQDEPVLGEKKAAGQRALSIAHTLCRNNRFQRWVAKFNRSITPDEAGAREFILKRCGIGSRKELVDSERAREELFKIRDSFEHDVRQGGA